MTKNFHIKYSKRKHRKNLRRKEKNWKIKKSLQQMKAILKRGLLKEDMKLDEHEAIEYFEYNINGAYMGEYTPYYLTK